MRAEEDEASPDAERAPADFAGVDLRELGLAVRADRREVIALDPDEWDGGWTSPHSGLLVIRFPQRIRRLPAPGNQ